MPGKAKIKKRKDGLYQRSVTIGKNSDGKPIRKTFYAKTTKLLDAIVSEYKVRFRYGMLSVDENMTFGELAPIWLKDIESHVRINTWNSYKSCLKVHLLPNLSNFRLKDLKPDHLQKIISSMAKKEMSRSRMHKVKIMAAQIMQKAMNNDIVHRNVFAKIKVPKVEPKVRRPLTKKEQLMICKTFSGHRMGIPALLLLFCGLRRSELLALTWNDIDIEKMKVTVNKGAVYGSNQPDVLAPKTAMSNREIPIPTIIIRAITAAKIQAKSNMVCPSAKGEIMSMIAYRRAWESYLNFLNMQAGGRGASRSRPKIVMIENITAHMFRHTYATLLYNADVDVKSAQALMGHADISTTIKIYIHLELQKKSNAIAALNKLLSKSIGNID